MKIGTKVVAHAKSVVFQLAEAAVPRLAYNLIRAAMATVAVSSDREPRELSVAGTVRALAALAEVLDTASGYESFVRVVRVYRVGNRPDRFEPRARKRRPKPYPPQTVPRAEARRRLARSP